MPKCKICSKEEDIMLYPPFCEGHKEEAEPLTIYEDDIYFEVDSLGEYLEPADNPSAQTTTSGSVLIGGGLKPIKAPIDTGLDLRTPYRVLSRPYIDVDGNVKVRVRKI